MNIKIITVMVSALLLSACGSSHKESEKPGAEHVPVAPVAAKGLTFNLVNGKTFVLPEGVVLQEWVKNIDRNDLVAFSKTCREKQGTPPWTDTRAQMICNYAIFAQL
ncbi:hypothetical protein [Oryzomicrobium sp.]|uniref:hypothetical protein n=1 Tax=Oryzomicrobium sp. TaxID=1911578 RepID=UPI002FE1B3D7